MMEVNQVHTKAQAIAFLVGVRTRINDTHYRMRYQKNDGVNVTVSFYRKEAYGDCSRHIRMQIGPRWSQHAIGHEKMLTEAEVKSILRYLDAHIAAKTSDLPTPSPPRESPPHSDDE